MTQVIPGIDYQFPRKWGIPILEIPSNINTTNELCYVMSVKASIEIDLIRVHVQILIYPHRRQIWFPQIERETSIVNNFLRILRIPT